MKESNEMSEFTNTLGSRLQEIMTQQYTATHWSKLLGISASAISQWFDEQSAPSLDNLIAVRDFIYDSGNDALIAEFDALCEEDLVDLTGNYRKFKADNLFDFLARGERDRIVSDLNSLIVESNVREAFYRHVSRFIEVASRLREEDLEKLMQIVVDFPKEVLDAPKRQLASIVAGKSEETAVGSSSSNASEKALYRAKFWPEKKAKSRGFSVLRPSF